MKDKKCSKCYIIIEPSLVTTSTYCRDCSSDYYKIYRSNKKPPNIKIEGLGEFIQKIIKNNYYIDFNDISIIIFFYQIITTDITEYDRYRTGEQIKFMWDKIYNFYVKKISKQKNI